MNTTDKQDDLDEMIHWATQMAAAGMTSSVTAKWVLGYLLELRDRRESDLIPVTKFSQGKSLDAAIEGQFRHIESEVEEAKFETKCLLEHENSQLRSMYTYFAALELIDLQTSCESMLQLLGYNEESRRRLRKKVIQKNTERGYYEE